MPIHTLYDIRIDGLSKRQITKASTSKLHCIFPKESSRSHICVTICRCEVLVLQDSAMLRSRLSMA